MTRVLVIGTGAMASLFAARLSLSGNAVTMFGSWRNALERANVLGVGLVEEGREEVFTRLSLATNDPTKIGGQDLVLFLNKAYQLEEGLILLSPWLGSVDGSSSILLTLQNGIGNREKIQQRAPGNPVYAGVTTMAAHLRAPAEVVITGYGSIQLPESRDAEWIASLFREAMFTAEVLPDQNVLLWRKLVVNAAINPLSAVHGVPNGDLIKNGKHRKSMSRLVLESLQVAESQGIHIDPEEMLEWVEQVCAKTASNRSSMLTDLDRGSRTEIDAINGEIVRIAERQGVEAPENRYWLQRVRDLEQEKGCRAI